LTCGHIFRESQGRGNIEVHLFGENSTVRVTGECLFYDTEIDLALVAVKSLPFPVRAAPIAPVAYQIQPAQQVSSVGCDHGGKPTIRAHQVMSTDKVGTPKTHRVSFQYVQVSGAPVSGRSGGGLFSNEGYLIGVCNTGGTDGLFVPTHIIRHVLTENTPAFVHQNLSLGDPPRQVALTPLQPLEPQQPMAAAAIPAPMTVLPAPMYGDNKNVMSREEQATLEEIKRRKQDGDEVILIVRPRSPGIPSDVIILNGVSDMFMDSLVKTPSPPSNPAYNPVILSSRPSEERQPASFSVVH
jgi:hypothetical protein